MSEFVYLNGELIPYGEARVPVEDRGFNFGDGIYEVLRVIDGRLFRLEDHLGRLQRSADALEIPLPEPEAGVTAGMRAVIERNGVRQGTVYLQVTRGVATRSHAFPERASPTTLIIARPAGDPPEASVSAITAPDTRWELCEVKTIGLLPNILASESARRAGAYEAIFVRDGAVTEGSRTSVFVVRDDVVFTHPIDNVLPGVTRALVLEQLRAADVDVRETAVRVEELRDADELFLTGTTTQVVGVDRLDGEPVGNSEIGPVTRMAERLYRETVDRFRQEGQA